MCFSIDNGVSSNHEMDTLNGWKLNKEEEENLIIMKLKIFIGTKY